MNETSTIPHTVSANMQTVPQNHELSKSIADLLPQVEAFKEKVKKLAEESSELARTVREVTIAQKQKEREYQQTKRAIERIRTVSGAA